MERTSVVSKTGMCGYGYDPATETLEIAFLSRKEGEPEKIYQYTPFKAADWEAFQAAPSKGSHFLKSIKPNFVCKRIEVDALAGGQSSGMGGLAVGR